MAGKLREARLGFQANAESRTKKYEHRSRKWMYEYSIGVWLPQYQIAGWMPECELSQPEIYCVVFSLTQSFHRLTATMDAVTSEVQAVAAISTNLVVKAAVLFTRTISIACHVSVLVQEQDTYRC